MGVDLTRITVLHLGLVAGSTLLASSSHLGEPLSILLGGGVMAANFVLLRVIVGTICSAAKSPERQGRMGWGVGAFLLKFTLFLVLLGGLFVRLPIEGMSFAFGATLLVVACVIEALRCNTAMAKGVS